MEAVVIIKFDPEDLADHLNGKNIEDALKLLLENVSGNRILVKGILETDEISGNDQTLGEQVRNYINS